MIATVFASACREICVHRLVCGFRDTFHDKLSRNAKVFDFQKIEATAAKEPKSPKPVEALKREEASRKNMPTAEYRSLMPKKTAAPVEVRNERRGTGFHAEKGMR